MSTPYGPQNPFPQQSPAPQQAFPPPPTTPGQYPAHAPGQAWNQAGHPPYGAPPQQRNGLAIAAIATSVVALLASLAVAAFVGFSVAGAGPGVLQGQVEPTGSTVAAAQLESALTSVIEQDGGFVDHIDCPDSVVVGQGLVAVCHGSVDDLDWTGIVVFEDESGTFTLNEL